MFVTDVPSTENCKLRLLFALPSGFVPTTVAPGSMYMLPTVMVAGLLRRLVMTGALVSAGVDEEVCDESDESDDESFVVPPAAMSICLNCSLVTQTLSTPK